LTTAPGPAQRVGVFGGAFDPPHIGHRALAQAALEQLQLDVLHIIPTGQAWHKPHTLTAPQHRLAMAQLAFGDLARVTVDPRETLRTGPSYTVDTLGELGQEYPGGQRFLILGQDQAQALSGWHRWQEIAQLAIICVASRAHPACVTGVFDTLTPALQDMRILKMPPVAVSATDIRQRLANHENVSALVLEPVARYIDHHHLYQTA
jgi:nicotinate-nucleotide adenylyltransferase